MRHIMVLLLFALCARSTLGSERPGLNAFIREGKLLQGEHALERYLDQHPKDDATRFGLGIIRLARSVETLGQSLHEHGCQANNTNVPFLRLPLPAQPDPIPISYRTFSRILDEFARNLDSVETTLAPIQDERIKLPVRLGEVRLDLDSDGKATDHLIDLLQKVMGGARFDFLQGNPDFLVMFDRGDVAWLRAYCHLLMGLIDLYQGFDFEAIFRVFAPSSFPQVKQGKNNPDPLLPQLKIRNPIRLGRARLHFVQVARLNEETWKFIRAETDNDYEWLPNPQQQSVFGLRVNDTMITNWLAMMKQLEELFEGERVLPVELFGAPNPTDGLSVRAFFEHPPEQFDLFSWNKLLEEPRYRKKGKPIDFMVFLQVWNTFDGPNSFLYPVWFN